MPKDKIAEKKYNKWRNMVLDNMIKGIREFKRIWRKRKYPMDANSNRNFYYGR